MKSPEAHAHLRRADDLITALSAEIPSVQSLRGRWSAIRSTLDRLRAAVAALATLPSPSLSNPLLSDLLRSLPETLNLILTLALNPPSGHLQTLSELSAAAAQLDRLASDADVLLRSPEILDSPAVISKRDEILALVARVQIGAAAARSAALEELVGVMERGNKEVVVAAAEGAVPAVARLLDSLETRDLAVAAIARISAVESCRHVLQGEGVLLLNHLARALESGGAAAAASACVALRALTVNRDAAMAVGSRGAVGALIAICEAGTPASQASAAGVLTNLAGVRELRENFVEENAVTILIRLFASGTLLARENAAACLRSLTASEESQSLKLMILRERGLERIKDYLKGANDDDRNISSIFGLLRNLAYFKYIGEIIAASGFVPLIVAALDHKASSTRVEAAKLVFELAFWPKARKEMGQLCSVSRLTTMLEGKGYEEKEAAVRALAALMQCAGNRRLFRKEERGVMNVVMLLDPLLKNVGKKDAIAVLTMVSQSRRCRKQMAAAGAIGYLSRLAEVEVEVEGAKRLLESLERGKLLGIFSKR